MTHDPRADLAVAREMARAGVPLFLAAPDPGHRTGFSLPSGWQHAAADPAVVDQWQPGWALCAVTGHVVDLVDVDPRSGGQVAREWLPTVVASARTPSGGDHYWVPLLGVGSRDATWPGVDVKAGTPDGAGRGFAFLPPTVRRSKVTGNDVPYAWTLRPDTAQEWRDLAAGGAYSTAGLRQRVLDLRAARGPEGTSRRLPRSVARAEWDRAYAALAADVARWAASGWGGEAHAGLLRHSTHLARLSPDHAEGAYLAAFAAAGVAADEADLAKLVSALEGAVPDVVVPDEECSAQELFWAGARAVPEVTEDPKPTAPADPIGRGDAGPFRFLTISESASIPMPDPLIEGVLRLSTKARLFGESTRGKTWVALDMAAHVALGRPWLGHPVKQGRVLYVAAEGAPSFYPRMCTWALANGVPLAELDTIGVDMWPMPVSIGGPEWSTFVGRVAEDGYVLVIGDTQAAMTVGLAEDSNDDAGRVHEAVGELVRASGGCFLGVHHVGWADQGRPRGASGMFGGMDTELRLAEGPRGLLLVSEKQRYGAKLPPIPMRLVEEHDGLVVRAPAGSAESLLTGDDHDVRVAAELERLRDYVARGGSVGQAGYRVVLRVLNEELRTSADEPVTERVARDAAYAYKRSVGLLA